MKRVLSTLVSALTLMMGPVANASTPAIPPLECVFDVECDHHALIGRSAQQHGGAHSDISQATSASLVLFVVWALSDAGQF